MVIRYMYGLGAMSNSATAAPGAFWISFDLYCGVALRAGASRSAGWVYLFNREKYHAVARLPS